MSQEKEYTMIQVHIGGNIDNIAIKRDLKHDELSKFIAKMKDSTEPGSALTVTDAAVKIREAADSVFGKGEWEFMQFYLAIV